MATNLENDYDLQEQLRQYAAGELPASDREALQARVSQSAEAAQEAQFSIRLAGALRYREQLQVGALVGNIINEEGLPPKGAAGEGGSWRAFIRHRGWWLGIALAGIIGLALLAGNFLQQAPPAQWRETFLQPLENVLYTDDETATHWSLRAGMDAYDAHNYAEAATQLSAHYGQSKDPNVGLFLGVAYLMERRSEDAIAVLSPVWEAQQGPAREAAQWYLALAFLDNHEVNKARTLLKSLPPDGMYFEQAQALLLLMK